MNGTVHLWEHAGTVSSGTLRDEDLIPAFFGKLMQIAPDRAAELARKYGYSPELSDSWSKSTEPSARGKFLDDLDSELNETAPGGYYFGALESDGAAFGFWPISDPIG